MKKHVMEPDMTHTLPASSEFPADELLIFIGHSDDASKEAEAIMELQTEIEKDFRRLLKSNRNQSPYRRIRLWEWGSDALALTGGQEAVVNTALDRAEIALFVFRERVGKVTWQELERVRKRRSETKPHVCTFFPEFPPVQGKFPDPHAKLKASRDWTDLLERQIELTGDWSGADSCSITPCPLYQDKEDLKIIVREKVHGAMADILSVVPFQPIPEPSSYGAELHRYQEALKTELGTISLLGTHALENIPVTMTDTFVSLRLSDTWRTDTQWNPLAERNQKREERIRTPEEVTTLVFETCRLLLVIGDPGSGKTTLLKHYALSCLENAHYTRLGFQEPVLVFFLPLRELVKNGTDYAALPVNLFAWSEKRSLGITETIFFDWLHNRQTLLLLDGLDEIGDPEERIKACDWIDRTVAGFEKARVVVTSRYTGYRKGDGIELRSQHVRADIMDFSAEQQKEFLERWFSSVLCRELRPASKTKEAWRAEQTQKAKEKAATIIGFLAQPDNRSLRLLAAVPMLLQIMAILWKERHYLPKTRSELYNAALNFILDYRDRQRDIKPLLSAEDARRILTPVSLWMQEELKTDEVDRAEMHVAMQKLLDNLDNPPSAEEFCDYLVKRAGLLMEYGATSYVFRHKSFREYLASVELIKKVLRTTGYLDTLISGFGEDWWEEPIKFFIAQSDAETFDLFMEKFFDFPKSEFLTPKQLFLLLTLIEEAPLKKIDALCKKLLDPKTTVDRQRLILDCLQAVGKSSALEAIEQFKTQGLAKNKDVADKSEEVMFVLRPGVGTVPVELVASRLPTAPTIITLKDRPASFRNPNEHNAEYILIQGGSYRCSMTKKIEKVADTYVAKYPITNRRYRSFIASLKSADEANSDNIFSIKLAELADTIPGFRTYLDEEPLRSKRFLSTYDDDRKFGGDDQPVVGVSWYAARAYCLWLSLLEGNPELYSLPTDIEWEYAAAGKEGRKYPWLKEKGEPTSKLANYGENIGATTPVGSYPEGATPEGLYDMAGNVWEWMDGIHEKYAPARSLRGGSWVNAPVYLRCSARLIDDPGNGSSRVGFRVVRSSHSLSS
jgi:formylglycine-generating enzyme required for sulfatase activity/energy-coupling factor transporter ATP-binding protein EcfA2